MSSPFKIFILLVSTILLLVVFIFAFPSGEIKLSDTLSIRFFSKQNLLNPGGTELVDISAIISGQGELEPDSSSATIDTSLVDSIAISPAEVVLVKNKIQFPEENDTALNTFFAALDEVADGSAAIRILHYGDSQMEGDRITSVIRQKFADHPLFSCCGTGLLPVKDLIQGRLAVRQKQSDNWTKYAVFEKNKETPPYRDYGLNGSFFRFSPFESPADTFISDSLVLDTIPADSGVISPEIYKAWIQIDGRAGGEVSTRQAEVFRLYFNHLDEPLTITSCFNSGDTLVEVLEPRSGFGFRQWPIEGRFRSAYLHFESTKSPDIYGVSIDCRTGTQVDNIGMRGSAVANFTAINPSILSAQMKAMNVKLVIMQFGVNVVPHVIEDYTYYERMYYGQLRALKTANPDLAILVIGVSDMARKDGLVMQSYPNIEKIRTAQKNAAFKAGVPFWDLYEAMGGKNAMVSWVENDPPYAEKDYTHFNPTGARVIGKMIFDAIMESYYVYKKVIQP